MFNKNLRELREITNLNQQQVARKLGIAVSTYANWEQGRREPDIKNILFLCAIFDCDANEILDWNEETKIALQAELYLNDEDELDDLNEENK